MRASLIVVDVQKGFTTLCPLELPVPNGLEIVPNINRLLDLPFLHVDATQDWHPPDHCSFLNQSGPYPPHCVQDTPGAEFVPGLNTAKFCTIWRKGYLKDKEAHSVAAQHPSSFQGALMGKSITHVFLCGLATNICVQQTALDLMVPPIWGLKVYIVENASAGIDIGPYNQAADKIAAKKSGIQYVNVVDVERFMK